jgi:uncharacterized protein YbjT (DUF2867 family)
MVLVVGSTGLLGGEVVRQLRKAGQPVRALARATSDPARLEGLRQAGAEIVYGDLKHVTSLRDACRGVDAIITTASSTFSRQENDSIQTVDRDGYFNLIDAAIEANVHRFVYTSIPPNLHQSPLTLAKYEIARRLFASGMDSTVLEANFFMEIWLSAAIGFNAESGHVTIYGNGNRPIGFVSYKNVAEIAVRSLLSEACRNRMLRVAGPENLTPLEVVQLFEQASGTSIKVDHVPEEVLEQKWQSAREPLEKAFAALMLDYATGCSMDMKETLGVLPVDLISVKDYALSVFRKAGAYA